MRAREMCPLPCDVLVLIFAHLDLLEVNVVRLVCREWAQLGRRDDVLLASAARTAPLTGVRIQRLLGLGALDVCVLPRRPFVTRKGRTCWLYGPQAVRSGLEMARGTAVVSRSC